MAAAEENKPLREDRFSETMRTAPGRPLPLGAWLLGEGVNFALFSRHATGVTLLLYAAAQDPQPAQRIALDPHCHRDGDIWHAWVADVRPGCQYGAHPGLRHPRRALR